MNAELVTKKINGYKKLQKTLKGLDYLDDPYLPTDGFLEGRIKQLNLMLDFKVNLVSANATGDYYKIDDFRYIALYDSSVKRDIAWPDNGVQPKNEWLFVISFPTGPYALSQSYPKNLFMSMWQELLKYNPKYVDSQNKSMYFTKENSEAVNESFMGIFNKYRKLSQSQAKQQQIEKLQKELDKLQGEEDA